MSNIKEYITDYDWKASVEIEIGHDVITEGKLHQINNFWLDSEYQFNKHGSILNAILIMLAQHALLIAISSGLSVYDVVCEFDWNDGSGQEGWPPTDGSKGVGTTDINTSGIFDSDDMAIEATQARRYRIPITFHPRCFSLCINKEHVMQYAITGWSIVGYPLESLLEQITRKLRDG